MALFFPLYFHFYHFKLCLYVSLQLELGILEVERKLERLTLDKLQTLTRIRNEGRDFQYVRFKKIKNQ